MGTIVTSTDWVHLSNEAHEAEEIARSLNWDAYRHYQAGRTTRAARCREAAQHAHQWAAELFERSAQAAQTLLDQQPVRQ